MTWKEQSVTIPVETARLVLEGIWQAGTSGGAVIAPPHPEYGGSFDHPVVNEIAYGLFREGIASLRFNWRGVGGSQGRPSGLWADAEADYAAALDQLAQTVSAPIIAAGYSFGAATALRVALGGAPIRRLLLVAPPSEMLRPLEIKAFSGPLHVIVGSRDDFAPVVELSEQLASIRNARIDVIPGADHFFSATGLAELQQLVRGAAA